MQLSSKNKKILIFSDPHQEIDKVEYIINKENADIILCLGDWFDSFRANKKEDIIKTCNFLKKWINKPNFFSLNANHDLSQLYTNYYTKCSGYTEENNKIIRENLGEYLEVIKNKLLWYVWVDDWFCSHAGINWRLFPYNLEINKEAISNWLDREIEAAKVCLESGQDHWLYAAGRGRGGAREVGGITWQDWDREFEPVEGISSLQGHSFHKTIVPPNGFITSNPLEANDLCIDCNLKEWIMIENGKTEIRS